MYRAMPPPPCIDSARIMSSRSIGSRPERSTAAFTTCSPRTNGSTSTSVPLKALPIGVRAVDTITASAIVFSIARCRCSRCQYLPKYPYVLQTSSRLVGAPMAVASSTRRSGSRVRFIPYERNVRGHGRTIQDSRQAHTAARAAGEATADRLRAQAAHCHRRARRGWLARHRAQSDRALRVLRPSLHEALRVLETEGLISVVRGVLGGVVVHRPDHRQTALTTALVLH